MSRAAGFVAVDCMASGRVASGRVAVDFVAVDARSSPPALLRIADIVFLSGACACPRQWVGDALARWSGSLVAAAAAGAGRRDCVVRTRGQAPVLFRVRAEDPECPVLACAAVAYWWAVSGRTLAELASRRIVLLSDPR